MQTTTTPQILSQDQLKRIAPAVFAAHAAPSTSSRYAFVPTSEVVTVLGRQGFEPVAAQEKRVRIEARRGYQSHVIRFRRTASGRALSVGDSIYELVLKTAHDGTSAFEFSAGLFRLVCSNGLVAPAGSFGGFSVKHVGYAARDVVEGVESMLDSLPAMTAAVGEMQAVELNRDEQTLLAESAARLRWNDNLPVTTDRLLTPRRYEDRGQDVWRTFNVIQENLVRGGVRGVAANGRRQRTRAMTGVDASSRLNRELWALAEGMAKLKRGESVTSMEASA